MIVYNPESVEISLPVAAALLAFASADDTRPHLGVGINEGALCATDGHQLVRFDLDTCEQRDGATPTAHNGKVWAAKRVEIAAKVARLEKRKTVVLNYADCETAYTFPPACHVIPKAGITAREPIGFNPSYLANIAKICKAVGANGAKLTSLKGSLDPLGFRVEGPHGGLAATAVVMPMRI